LPSGTRGEDHGDLASVLQVVGQSSLRHPDRVRDSDVRKPTRSADSIDGGPTYAEPQGDLGDTEERSGPSVAHRRVTIYRATRSDWCHPVGSGDRKSSRSPWSYTAAVISGEEWPRLRWTAPRSYAGLPEQRRVGVAQVVEPELPRDGRHPEPHVAPRAPRLLGRRPKLLEPAALPRADELVALDHAGPLERSAQVVHQVEPDVGRIRRAVGKDEDPLGLRGLHRRLEERPQLAHDGHVAGVPVLGERRQPAPATRRPDDLQGGGAGPVRHGVTPSIPDATPAARPGPRRATPRIGGRHRPRRPPA
jgi:hypothetical protein